MKQKENRKGEFMCTKRRKCRQGSSNDLTASRMNDSFLAETFVNPRRPGLTL